MTSGQGIVENYYRVCECAWQQPCATADLGFTGKVGVYDSP
jgi:hypothetical protein